MPYGMNMLLWTADATGENFLVLFERLKKMGFDSVEIPIMTPDVGKYAELGRRLENMGLKRTAVTVLTSETNLIGTDRKQREGGVAGDPVRRPRVETRVTAPATVKGAVLA